MNMMVNDEIIPNYDDGRPCNSYSWYSGTYLLTISMVFCNDYLQFTFISPSSAKYSLSWREKEKLDFIYLSDICYRYQRDKKISYLPFCENITNSQ